MNTNKQLQGKKAELTVFGELLERGALPYLPLVDAEGVDAVVSVDDGRLLRVQIKAAGVSGGKHPRWFQVEKLAVADDFFVICVEAPKGVLGDIWIFPSAVFDAYATSVDKSGRELELDKASRKHGQLRYELLIGFKNRWELITEYGEYKELLSNPEGMANVLAMK